MNEVQKKEKMPTKLFVLECLSFCAALMSFVLSCVGIYGLFCGLFAFCGGLYLGALGDENKIVKFITVTSLVGIFFTLLLVVVSSLVLQFGHVDAKDILNGLYLN